MTHLCPHCKTDEAEPVWRDACLRVVHANEAGFPAFYRMIANRHVTEWSDLRDDERAHFMAVLLVIEQSLRELLVPTKINLASLGNAVPHVHWHIVARFDWDSHYPQSVWGSPQRPVPAERLAHIERQLPTVTERIVRSLNAMVSGAPTR